MRMLRYSSLVLLVSALIVSGAILYSLPHHRPPINRSDALCAAYAAWQDQTHDVVEGMQRICK